MVYNIIIYQLNRPAIDLLNFIKIEKTKYAGFWICNKE